MYESVESRMVGKPSTRFWLELFSNSAQFPIANVLFELLITGSTDYLLKPTLYVMAGASVVQAHFISQRPPASAIRQLAGNLIGPLLYTLVEVALEGERFFSTPHHLAYWGFAFVIGVFQALHISTHGLLLSLVSILENLTRASILFFMYVLFESQSDPTQTTSVAAFFHDTSHQFIGAAILLIGLSSGLSKLTSERYFGILKQTSIQLKTYSEWLLGRDLLARVIDNPDALNLARRQRVVLFMDIRNFTSWSEAHSPEGVVGLLNQYYQIAESILAQYPIIKFKPSADEVLAVFATVDHAIAAALSLQKQINEFLSNSGLGVGIGVHCGPVVEGLSGSSGVKFYDVIGDTVNTAKRIESVAQMGEVLVSESLRKVAGERLAVSVQREIDVKGKRAPVVIYRVEGFQGANESIDGETASPIRFSPMGEARRGLRLNRELHSVPPPYHFGEVKFVARRRDHIVRAGQ